MRNRPLWGVWNRLGSLGNSIDGVKVVLGKTTLGPLGPFLPSALSLHHAPGVQVGSTSAEVITLQFSTVGPAPCTQGPDAFHFVALKSSRDWDLSVGSFAASKEGKEERKSLLQGSIGQSWKWGSSPVLTFHWPALSHMATYMAQKAGRWSLAVCPVRREHG